MDLDQNDYLHLREQILLLPVWDLDHLLTQTQYQSGNPTLEHLRILLSLKIVKDTEVDYELLEQFYQQLVAQREGDEQSEKFGSVQLQAEFWFLYFKLFQDELAYTRSQKCLQKLERLYEENTDDQYVAYKYLSAKLSVNQELIALEGSDVEEWGQKIWDIVEERGFTDEKVKEDLRFSRLGLRIQSFDEKHFEKYSEVIRDIIDIIDKSRSIYYLLNLYSEMNFISQLDVKKVEELEILKRINLLKEEILKSHPEEELWYFNLFSESNLMSSELQISPSIEKLEGLRLQIDRIWEHNKCSKFLHKKHLLYVDYSSFMLGLREWDHTFLFKAKKEFLEDIQIPKVSLLPTF